MQRKTTDTPTRIYSYRCLPPVTERELVERQYHLAHEYRNALVEIERRRRDRNREVVLGCPITGSALLHAEDCEAAVDAMYDDLRMAKSGDGEPSEELRDQLEAAKELRREAWSTLHDAKREAAALLKPGYDAARDLAQTEALGAKPPGTKGTKARRSGGVRANFVARGLRHGAYARVQDAMTQASKAIDPPEFRAYDGTGAIGTQLTAGDDAMGLTVSELLSCQDTRLRLGGPGEFDAHPRTEIAMLARSANDRDGRTASPDEAWSAAWRLPRNLRRHAARTYVDLRVGSNEDRSPIFARFPVTFHRPLPHDAVIKWAYIVRKRIGRRFEWRFQLTIESETFRAPTQPVGDGTVAINLGWRNLIDGDGNIEGVRVAYLVDDSGNEREVRLPERVRLGLDKPRDLASIRAKEFDAAREVLRGWVAMHNHVPKWLQQLAAASRNWRAERKLAGAIDRWRHPISSDDEAALYDRLRAWAKQDRHLLDWQAHQADSRLAHRREIYRALAAELCRTYATIVTHEIDLTDRKFAQRPRAEDGDPSEGREQRSTARLAAPGELRDAIRRAAHKHGARVVELGAAGITVTCHACRSVEEWDRRAEIRHVCSSCGLGWDQDANACRNLLRLHREMPETSAEDPRPDGKTLADRTSNEADALKQPAVDTGIHAGATW